VFTARYGLGLFCLRLFFNRSQTSPCEICGGQSGTATSISPSTSVSPVSIIPPMLHTHVYLHVALTRRPKL
jgi:hypothetical protein